MSRKPIDRRAIPDAATSNIRLLSTNDEVVLLLICSPDFPKLYFWYWPATGQHKIRNALGQPLLSTPSARQPYIEVAKAHWMAANNL